MKRDAKDGRRIREEGVTARSYLSLAAARQAESSLRANGWTRIAVHGHINSGQVNVTAARDDTVPRPWLPGTCLSAPHSA